MLSASAFAPDGGDDREEHYQATYELGELEQLSHYGDVKNKRKNYVKTVQNPQNWGVLFQLQTPEIAHLEGVVDQTVAQNVGPVNQKASEGQFGAKQQAHKTSAQDGTDAVVEQVVTAWDVLRGHKRPHCWYFERKGKCKDHPENVQISEVELPKAEKSGVYAHNHPDHGHQGADPDRRGLLFAENEGVNNHRKSGVEAGDHHVDLHGVELDDQRGDRVAQEAEQSSQNQVGSARRVSRPGPLSLLFRLVLEGVGQEDVADPSDVDDGVAGGLRWEFEHDCHQGAEEGGEEAVGPADEGGVPLLKFCVGLEHGFLALFEVFDLFFGYIVDL